MTLWGRRHPPGNPHKQTQGAIRKFFYEVEGRIEIRLLHPNGEVWQDYKGDFRVFVNGCGWLIQTVETNDFGIPLRREIGTTNGTELFEMAVPYEPLDSPPGAATNAWGPLKGARSRPAGLLTSHERHNLLRRRGKYTGRINQTGSGAALAFFPSL